MKYINKQPLRAACGPVAMINAMKWLGKKGMSFRKFFPILTEFGYDAKKGICNKRNISRYLNIHNVEYCYKNYPTMQDIEKALDNGDSVLLNYTHYWPGGNTGHYVFIDKHTEKCFYAINANGNPTGKINNWLRKKQLGKWFTASKRARNTHPEMWTIKR